MDTSSFVLKRRALVERMEAERAHLVDPPTGNGNGKGSVLQTAFFLAAKWGMFPLLQDWALSSVGQWIYKTVRGEKARR